MLIGVHVTQIPTRTGVHSMTSLHGFNHHTAPTSFGCQLDYATAGVTGGQMGINGNTIASDLPTSTMLCNLVYAGRGSRTVTKPEPTNVNGTTVLQPVSVWECFDLRTGEVYWDLQGMQIPTFIEYSISVTTAAGSEDAVTVTLTI